MSSISDDTQMKMIDNGNILMNLTVKNCQARVKYCNAIFDGFLCWPRTEAGEKSSQACPPVRLSDTTREAFRQCSENGSWLTRYDDESDPKGWTNYTPCFPTVVRDLLGKVSGDDAQSKFEIAQRTRNLEIVGFSTSLIALLMSLLIFFRFNSLRNSRTNIHRNLFIAMTIQVIIRLVVYTDQAIIRDEPDIKGIDEMPYCEVSYVLLEYAISAMFMWMFIEGLFLHNVVTTNVLRERTSQAFLMGIGWGLPILVTTLWAIITAFYYNNDPVKRCWYGYNFLPEYWFLQGPRLSVILINLMFLLNIMRVLITKLNATENNEITKVKKAAKAALVLLPLLGITNILNMIEPIEGSVWKFAVWCYSTYFLRSFQGFFIALIYCFMNGEVNEVIRKSYRDWQNERDDIRRSRIARTDADWWPACPMWLVNQALWLQGHVWQIRNPLHDVELAMETSEEVRTRNYADPEYQSCMEEIRIKNDVLVTGTV